MMCQDIFTNTPASGLIVFCAIHYRAVWILLSQNNFVFVHYRAVCIRFDCVFVQFITVLCGSYCPRITLFYAYVIRHLATKAQLANDSLRDATHDVPGYIHQYSCIRFDCVLCNSLPCCVDLTIPE